MKHLIGQNSVADRSVPPSCNNWLQPLGRRCKNDTFILTAPCKWYLHPIQGEEQTAICKFYIQIRQGQSPLLLSTLVWMQIASFNISCSCNCYIKRKDTRFWRWDGKRLTAVLGSEDKWGVQPCQIPTCKNKETDKKKNLIAPRPHHAAYYRFLTKMHDEFFFPPYWKVRGSQYLCLCLEYNLIVKLYGNSLL